MEIQIGDKVQVVQSPYESVKVGTEAVVVDVSRNHFGQNDHLFRLDLPLNKHFRNHEIKKITIASLA